MLVYDEGEGKSYSAALERARKELEQSDPEEIARRTGLEYDSEESVFRLDSFSENYIIHYPSGTIDDSRADIPINRGMEIIMLHFLLAGNDCPPSDKLMTMQELPDGPPYAGPFRRQAIDPLAEAMADHADDLEEAAAELGAEFIDKADIGFKIYPLPHVPLVYLLWRGDEDIAGGANLAFDSSLMIKLHTEDIAVLGEYTTSLLLERAGVS